MSIALRTRNWPQAPLLLILLIVGLLSWQWTYKPSWQEELKEVAAAAAAAAVLAQAADPWQGKVPADLSLSIKLPAWAGCASRSCNYGKLQEGAADMSVRAGRA